MKLEEQRRVKLLGAACGLAGAIFNHYQPTARLPKGKKRASIKEGAVRAVILAEAAELGVRAASRAELSAATLQKICDRLKEQMKREGIPVPRSKRRRDNSLRGDVMRRYWLVAEILMTDHGWTKDQVDATVARVLRGKHGVRTVQTAAHARAAHFALQAQLRRLQAARKRGVAA